MASSSRIEAGGRRIVLHRLSLQVFLHCTLGGFAPDETGRGDEALARMYRADRLVDDIVEISGLARPTVYKRLRRMGVKFRRAA